MKPFYRLANVSFSSPKVIYEKNNKKIPSFNSFDEILLKTPCIIPRLTCVQNILSTIYIPNQVDRVLRSLKKTCHGIVSAFQCGIVSLLKVYENMHIKHGKLSFKNIQCLNYNIN